jgi:hypothetical protein
VRFCDALKHDRCCTGLVLDGHQRHLLLLHHAKAGFVQALPRAGQIGGQYMHDAVHLRVAVDVDAGRAHRPDRLGQHAGAIV